MSPDQLLAEKGDFLRTIGQILNCVVRFQLDADGRPKIKPIYLDEEVRALYSRAVFIYTRAT